LGHGITLKEDPELMKEVAEKGICVECCVTGNVGSKISGYALHPIRPMFNAGVCVTLNSDNQLMSGAIDRPATTVEDVCKLVEYLGFSWSEMKQVLLNGAKSSFTPLPEGWLLSFEQEIDSVLTNLL